MFTNLIFVNDILRKRSACVRVEKKKMIQARPQLRDSTHAALADFALANLALANLASANAALANVALANIALASLALAHVALANVD